MDMVKERGASTLEALYEALRTPEIVRTVWREPRPIAKEAPPAALVVLVHPAKPDIDCIVGQWFSWSRRRQEGFVKAIKGEGSPLAIRHINAYVKWVQAKVTPLPVGEVSAAIGAGGGGGGRIRLNQDMSSSDFVNSHAVRLPTKPEILYPLGSLRHHLAAIPELNGWWANRRKYGDLNSFPWLRSGIEELARRMRLEARVVGLSRGD